MIITYKAQKKEEELIENVFDTVMSYFVLHDIGVDVTMLGVDAIRKVNRENRNVDAPTDVLSFPTINVTNIRRLKPEFYPNDVDQETGDLYIGEIFISRKIAQLQAERMKHSYEIELTFLLIHGLLHLLGFDHVKDEDRLVMREKETMLMCSLGYSAYNYED